MAPTGMILAGGLGKRLRPATDNLPKPLLELKEGYCILDKQIDDFRFAGVERVVLLTGHLHELIEQRYGHNYKGLVVEHSVEDKPLGTWGAIRKAMKDFDVKGALVIMNGDILTDVDIASMLGNNGHPVTILGVQMRSQYGTLELSGTSVVSFKEKPILPYYINGGIYTVRDSADLLEVGKSLGEPSSLEQDVFPKLARAGKLGAYIESDPEVFWRSLDSIKDLEELRTLYQSRTDKPWGYELVVALTDKYLQKKLYIKEGHRTSFHYHEQKMETLYVVKGKARVELESGPAIELDEGQRYTVPPKQVHSIVAVRNTLIDEASSPHPSDTIRVKDFYVR